MTPAHHPVLTATYTKPEHCPKFQTCNAAICPLDAHWYKRSHFSEDATCFYLIESVKHDAQANFERCQPLGLYAAIVSVRSVITLRSARLLYLLERAKTSGSRMTRKVGKRHASRLAAG